MKKLNFLLSIASLFFILLNCQKKAGNEVTMLREQLAKFVPTEISYDTSLLTEKETVVLEKLYQAGKIMDEIFLKQVYSRNEEILAELQKSRAETDQLRLQLFHIMFGPFNRLDHNNPFYGNGAKPAGADFYPEDMTKEEFLKWIENHPENKESFTSEFTVIRREGDKLLAIPYP